MGGIHDDFSTRGEESIEVRESIGAIEILYEFYHTRTHVLVNHYTERARRKKKTHEKSRYHRNNLFHKRSHYRPSSYPSSP